METPAVSQHDEFEELLDAEDDQRDILSAVTSDNLADPGEIEMTEWTNTNPATGLTHEQVEQRLRKFGKNQLPEEKTNHFKKFLGYFTSPIELVIEFAAILALAVQDWVSSMFFFFFFSFERRKLILSFCELDLFFFS